MSSNCYGYLKTEIDGFSSVYVFTTDYAKTYTVYFEMDTYSKYLDEYPFLLQNGYSFGFYYQDFDATNPIKANDSHIWQTIADIVLDFLNDTGNDAFLLFHCDTTDGRQKYRQKLFSKWFQQSPESAAVVMPGMEVEIKSNDNPITHYIGFIASRSNPNLKKAEDELVQFSVDLINVNKV